MRFSRLAFTIAVSFLFTALLATTPIPAVAVHYIENFEALPSSADNPENRVTPAKAKLGRFLFFDARLSKSGIISCNTCHNLSTAGVDNLPTSIGHGWFVGPRNSPTVLNAAFWETQFWDGRAEDLEEQAPGPILNPGEMASTEELVVKRIGSIPGYAPLFESAYPNVEEPVNFLNITLAIAAFERTLLSPSKFDYYLKGETEALSRVELKGFDLFVEKGCVRCHNGVGVGGAGFEKFDYGTDLGRFEVTGDEADKSVFRVASLRNVALTYPYFHDGSVWSLEDAVRIMAGSQLGVELTEREIERIVAFLKSLSGYQPRIEVPVLPPSSIDTPIPVSN